MRVAVRPGKRLNCSMPRAVWKLAAPLLVVWLVHAGAPALTPTAIGDVRSKDQFVKAAGTEFELAGKPFFVTGVNNHYLTYGTKSEVTRVLDDAVAMRANVVRVFLQPVIGSLDGKVPTIWDWRSQADSSNLGVNGAYLLYWDDAAQRMAINAGANGMQKVDFLIDEAAKRHLKLIVAFLDFWAYTGGAQQISGWYGSHGKSFFFTDPRTRTDYQDWVRYVVDRVNPLTGVAYKDDATIMAWELMNEPNPGSDEVRLAWLAAMSAYVKSLDPNHLVGSGAANVTNRLDDLSIPTIDFGTWHGYPLYYKLSVAQFNDLIPQFCDIAAAKDKPVLLEEFGYARSNPDQAQAYDEWLHTLDHDPKSAGWLVWRLVARQQDGRYPADTYDEFDIHNDGSPVWNVLRSAAIDAGQSRERSASNGGTVR
jgi:mannan endo-1,4-beta-mannosidase